MEDPKFIAVFSIVRRALRIVGYDVFAERWRPNPWSVLVMAVLLVQPFLSLRFMLNHTDSFSVIAEGTAVMITILDALFSLLEIIVNREAWKAVMRDVHARRFVYKSPNISKLFDKYYERNYLYCRFLYASYMSCFSYCLLPLVKPDPIKNNLPYPFTLPYVDPSGFLFYPLNFVYQSVLTIIVQHVLIAQCSALIIGIISACCQINAVKLKIQELNELINDSSVKPSAVRESLFEIIQLHASTKDYISRIQQKYSLVYLSVFGTCGGIVCMCLNIISEDFLGSANFLFMAGTFSVAVHCFFGNTLLIENDSLPDAIYAINWYKLPLPDQKVFCFLLENAQPETMLDGILMPLNMRTFVSIMKAAFSYYSILNKEQAK